MSPVDTLSDRQPIPLELIDEIIAIVVANESRFDITPPEDDQFQRDVSRLTPFMVQSMALYQRVTPHVFRDIKCTSASRLDLLNQILNANPTLATYVRFIRLEHKDDANPWLRDPILPGVIESIAKGGHLESLVIDGNQTADSSWEIELSPALDEVLISLTHRPESVLKKLYLRRFSISERLIDGLGPSLQFLELVEIYRPFGLGQVLISPPRKIPLQITTLAISNRVERLVWRMCKIEEDIPPYLPQLTKLVLLEVGAHNQAFVTHLKYHGAPNLDCIRLSIVPISDTSSPRNRSREPRQYYCDVDWLCSPLGRREFRHLEIIHPVSYPSSLIQIPNSNTIDYLSKARGPLSLETLTIFLKPPPDYNSESEISKRNLPSTNDDGRVGRGKEAQVDRDPLRDPKQALYKTLDTVFYSKLRRVILDFRDWALTQPKCLRRLRDRVVWLVDAEEGTEESLVETFYGAHVRFEVVVRI